MKLDKVNSGNTKSSSTALKINFWISISFIDDMEEEYNSDAIRSKKYKIILWGLLVHVLLLFAVFDVYFATPLDKGMTPVKSIDQPVAKRLVLFVADGLRAEAVFGADEDHRIPFLTKLKQSGSWGVVHTRMPTESRPGHVAMLAGIYEDPSAIFKGWKANPVPFDSVISQSSNSWCWGSPDIITLFNKDKLPTVHLHSYGAEMEDFGKYNTGALDTWVYNKVEKFLSDVRGCRGDYCKRYFKDGNLFFLHLLGIDTAGHGYKPHSQQYINNILLVDEIIKNVTELFEATYNDASTAYVFTSDHGMTDWGSHGAGSRHETEVPLIAWGAGVKANYERQDINQIDIAPLLSSLIGINIPINSLGIIPINYLNLGDHELAEALHSNTLQLLQLFNIKKMRVENNALVVVPFKGIASEPEILRHLNGLKKSRNFQTTITAYKDLMKHLINGVNYYHNYYQYPVLFAISAGFLSWIIFLFISVFYDEKQNKLLRAVTSNKNHNKVVIAIILIVLLLCYKQKFPLTYYLYFLLPVVMFSMVVQSVKTYDILSNLPSFQMKHAIINIFFYLIGLELLIYGFFDRTAFSVLMLLVGIWIFASKSLYNTSNKKEKLIWISCCFVLAVFPSLPVMKTSFSVPMYVSGFVGWLFLFKQMYINKTTFYDRLHGSKIQYNAFTVQFSCLIMAAVYVLSLENGYISNDSALKYVSWLFLVLPILMVPLTSTFIAVRLIATFFAFAPFYLLVSPNYEVLFSVFYVALLCSWLFIESKSFQFGNASSIIYYAKFESYRSKNKINSDCFRRAFLFMVFIFLGFFGTGNIASLNSFDPMWVRAFLTVFSPFKMTGLILLKLTVPFIFTCCVFRAINSVGRESILNTFCIILIFSDLMLLQFLYLITNVGSWLDIGTSLSHFIIMEAFVTILLLLYGLAHVLTTVTYYNN